MNKYSYLLVFFITFLTVSTQAQDLTPKDSTATNIISYEKGKEYILGGITVTGLQKFSEQTVRIYTGLTEGQPVKLPGDKLTSAIKKLYESKQFSEVDVYLSKRDGETVYLQFDVTELPQLTDVTITGVKKAQVKEIKKETELKKVQWLPTTLL